MRLIKQSKLFYIEGKSDKVYEIDLCEISSNEFLVNFRYGRRGSTLKEGTKTPEAVSREKADALFASLEAEKRKKGYQTETETFVELPVLDVLEPNSIQGTILQRLQDAVDGKNSFKTQWKTSRVIWKAAELEMKEAVPFIMRLTKGDEIQIYAALWALLKLDAKEAEQIFKSYAGNIRQKAYIRNIATEALLTFLSDDNQRILLQELQERIPVEVMNLVETKEYDRLSAILSEHSQNKQIEYFTDLYLLAKVNTDILPVLCQVINSWKYRPPFFKHIRAIYKLAQVRKDYFMIAVLSYRFEKEDAMFKSSEYETGYRRYIEALNDYILVEAELKKKDSRLAYSSKTKKYFRKNSVNYLKQTGLSAGAEAYLKLAVSTLLQYEKTDYAEAGERPVSEYGQYNYSDKLYYYTLYNYPECYNSLLLSTILFGSDPNRKLQSNLNSYTSQRTVVSDQYWYRSDRVRPVGSKVTSDTAKSQNKSSTFGFIKSIFGKKETVPQSGETSDLEMIETNITKISVPERTELFPEHWDSMPQAYIQLLMQANLAIIHQFAYNNLKKHLQFEALCKKFDENAIIQLLNRDFELPNQLGYEVLIKRENEFFRNVKFIADVLNSNSIQAHEWTKSIVDKEPEFFLNDLDFMLSLIFNNKNDNQEWIDELLKKTSFTEERLQVVVGKIVAEMLNFDNSDENNAMAQLLTRRIKIIASSQLERIGWNIVEQLITSPVLSNTLLASEITLKKTQKSDPAEIPVSLVELFLQNNISEVRANGISLFNSYPAYFLEDNFRFVLNQLDNCYQDVVEKVLISVRNLIKGNVSLAEKTVRHLVYTMIRREKFEGAHALINQFICNELKPYWATGLTPKDITKLIHAQYRQSQLTGYEILKGWSNPNDFSIAQIISFGGHELLAVRQWCWQYYKNNVPRIRYEKEKSLNLLDSKWDDTREYAFHFFRTEFADNDWDADTLISIVDSIRPDVETFGKELITRYFTPESAMNYLTKLSEHPSVNVQSFVTGYLKLYAGGKVEVIRELDSYFRSVLSRVNKARVAKNRIYRFLREEALKNEEIAAVITPVLDDISAQSTIQDKAVCIETLTAIKTLYPHLDMHLSVN